MCIRDRYNTVLRTAPAAGTVLEAGETLTVYINREELAVGSTIAPSCVGLGQNEAGRLLTSRAVSYTHLDVYKRQVQRVAAGG